MNPSQWRRLVSPLVALMATGPALTAAQEWQLVYGAGSRAEYTDNYFYVAPSSSDPTSVGPESTFTLSVIPFVAAVRRTEVSEVKALVSVGANKAWGVSEEYLSARAALAAAFKEERSTWRGSLSYERASELQNLVSGGEVALARTYTDSVLLDGAFMYRLAEQWSAGGGVSGSYNRYESVQNVSFVTDDANFSAFGDLRYDYSDRTHAVFSVNYVYSTGDLTRSDIVTTRAGIAHRYSPQLAVSATLGWYWSDTSNRSGTPGALDMVGRDDGGLFGGSIEYAVTETTQFTASASQGLATSGAGSISRSDNVAVGLTHRFSDVLRGRAGAAYARTTFPGGLDDAYSDKTAQAEVGLSWRFAELWTMDAGYRYSRTRYSLQSGEPSSDVVFVSLAYNWPGAALTGWIGNSSGSRNLTGAGPIMPSDYAAPNAGAAIVAPSVSEPQPFEPFTLP